MCFACDLLDYFDDIVYFEVSVKALSHSWVTIEGLSAPTPPAQIVLGQKSIIHVAFYN